MHSSYDREAQNHQARMLSSERMRKVVQGQRNIINVLSSKVGQLENCNKRIRMQRLALAGKDRQIRELLADCRKMYSCLRNLKNEKKRSGKKRLTKAETAIVVWLREYEERICGNAPKS